MDLGTSAIEASSIYFENSIIEKNIGITIKTNYSGFYGYNLKILNSKFIDNELYIRSSNSIILNSIFKKNSSKNRMISSYHKSLFLNNSFIENSAEKEFIYSAGLFVNNIFKNTNELDINFQNEAILYSNYIDYNKLKENNRVITKKENIQASKVEIEFESENLTLKENSPLINRGLNLNSKIFETLISNYTNDKDIKKFILQTLKSDINGNIRDEKIDIGALEFNLKNNNIETEKIDISNKNSEPFLNINKLENGWHLLGTEKNLSNIKEKYNLKSLWQYKNGNWFQSNIIEAGYGFWIKK